MKRLKTVIVEDTTETRKYLARQLERLDNIELIGAVGTVHDGMALLEGEVDLLIADLGLPDGSGIDLIRTIKKREGAKAIVVTVFGDEKNVVGAIEAGADGYLLKDADGAEIAAALVDALNGVAPISPAIAGHLLQRIRNISTVTDQEVLASEHAQLTERETVILETLAKGFSYKEIARIQNVSFHTVNEHLKSIYKKLAVNSRGEAVYEAVQAGLIKP